MKSFLFFVQEQPTKGRAHPPPHADRNAREPLISWVARAGYGISSSAITQPGNAYAGYAE